ncbi:hypothetical protein [Methylobacterium oxalidis]|uniref:Uncharacterized protein n=1 Tax=Methylobacterium oxalidis TaxID=944322 RepID=A0A512J915_9HYPH|nr:hypothetical protein [Methylobacterium oxalidis]GEP06457.1 hypothetical protein MOX02_44950 [Methylobacterium oxalidis]GJE33520.1 hypothetical protein LDDCCGHA_3720 [Methylobacterium oxalidis]GLS65497.1 hypothetical protein GCM10007888_38790 [Methylobacterium oxalidis]
MKTQRAVEAPLRTVAALGGTPALALSAWRGASGRRYVVGIHPVDVVSVEDCGPAVVLAVRREHTGLSTLMAVEIADGTGIRNATAWIRNIRADGCNEIHIHRLCEGYAERAALLHDLTTTAVAPQPDAGLARFGG